MDLNTSRDLLFQLLCKVTLILATSDSKLEKDTHSDGQIQEQSLHHKVHKSNSLVKGASAPFFLDFFIKLIYNQRTRNY